MIRLVELEPVWLLDGERIVGVSFDCACCRTFAVSLLFANPIGGGAPMRQDHRTVGDHSGIRYRRHGETFETLTIEGVILSSKAHHWAGRISDGEISP